MEEFPDGVWFVNLAALTDPELVFPLIAQTLAVKEQPGETMLETLASHVAKRRLLLVLDNFEQVRGGRDRARGATGARTRDQAAS